MHAVEQFPAFVEGPWRKLRYGSNMRIHISPFGVFYHDGAQFARSHRRLLNGRRFARISPCGVFTILRRNSAAIVERSWRETCIPGPNSHDIAEGSWRNTCAMWRNSLDFVGVSFGECENYVTAVIFG